MQKLKIFVQKKSTIKKLVIFTGLLFAAWINFIIFSAVTGASFSLARAQNTIKIGGIVSPKNPIDKVSDAESGNDQPPAADYKSSDYRLVTAIPSISENKSSSFQSPSVKSPIITFRGKAIYPNSEVFLVIRSGAVFTSVTSDSQGNWSWTNLGQPLENGKHSIEASNIAPYDLSGKRDIFFQKFIFLVEADGSGGQAVELPLEDLATTGAEPASGDIGERFAKNALSDTYLFNIALLDKKECYPGDEMNLRLEFIPLGNTEKKDVRIVYGVYNYNKSDLGGSLVYSFEDKVNLASSKVYLKKIRLKNDVQAGDYFIKVSAEMGNDEYIQAARFAIGPRTVIQIGSAKIDENNFGAVIAWDIIFILGFAILILMFIIFEYRQMSICNLVDEDELRSRHYFSN